MARPKPAAKRPARDARATSQPQKTRLWLMYPQKLITNPVIWELGHKFKVVTNSYDVLSE